jgi:hypothetical protein
VFESTPNCGCWDREGGDSGDEVRREWREWRRRRRNFLQRRRQRVLMVPWRGFGVNANDSY